MTDEEIVYALVEALETSNIDLRIRAIATTLLPVVRRVAAERYEVGYRNGESSGYADYAIALSEVLPDDIDAWSPASVAAYIHRLAKR